MLFVDCDDTLVVWDDAALMKQRGAFNEFTSTDWAFNPKVVALIEATPTGVIWTGGGIEYARLWLNRLERKLGRRLDGWIALSKYTPLPKAGDTCIDDMPIKVACEVIHPNSLT